MNVIGIMLDSFRQDHVSYYSQGAPVFEGVQACKTPNLDAFAQDCIVFTNAYPEALPTIPVRTQLFTGQRTLPFRSWQPLTKEDVTVSEILREHGYVCGLISDCYHFRAPGMNYHRGFHAYRWIRGQEYDPWVSRPPQRDLEQYVNNHYDQPWRQLVAQFLANTDHFTDESDWFPAVVVDEAIGWLKRNRVHKRLFAWIDSFDPHEPWDPPDRFDYYTDPNYDGKRLIMPLGGDARRWASHEEILHIRGLYAGEAEFVDHCLGRLFKALEDLGYLEDSVILIMADHGHPLGDHGKFLKGGDRLYNELLRVPLMIRLPGGKGARRTDAIIQFHDVLPTLLELIGLSNETSAMQGQSFVPVLTGEKNSHRQTIITGYHAAEDRCMRDLTWSFIQRPEGQPDELYNLLQDPLEKHNLVDDHTEEARRLVNSFGNYFRQRGHAMIKGIQGRYELSSSSIV